MKLLLAVEGTKAQAKEQVAKEIEAAGPKVPSGMKAAAQAMIDAQPAQHLTGTIEAEFRAQFASMSAVFNYHASDEVNVEPPPHVVEARKAAEVAEAQEMKETGRKPGEELRR